MKKVKQEVNLLLKRAVRVMLESDPGDWPPKCLTFSYQPMRPQQKPTDHVKD